MITTENKLLVLNKELEENFAHLDRQHAQVKWFVQLYTFTLAGFFALSGYLVNKSASPLSSMVGFSGGFLVFCLGWLLLSTLAHKMAMIILLHKQISIFRGHRLSLLGNEYESEYVFPTSPKSVRFAKLIDTMPYVFFVLNYIILCGSTGFYVSRVLSVWVGITSSLAIGTIVGLLYPRSCVAFNKHIKTAKLATSLAKKHELERMFEDLRKKSKARQHLFYRVVVGLITLFVFAAIGLVVLSIWAKTDLVRYILLLLSFINAAFFGIVRYAIEKIKGFKVEVVG